MVAFISGVQKEIGKEKFTFESKEIDHELFEAIKEYAIDRVKYALDTDDKVEREARLGPYRGGYSSEIRRNPSGSGISDR